MFTQGMHIQQYNAFLRYILITTPRLSFSFLLYTCTLVCFAVKDRGATSSALLVRLYKYCLSHLRHVCTSLCTTQKYIEEYKNGE